MMDSLIYGLAKGVVLFLQLWPLRWVARFGRLAGGLAYLIDGRHRRVAAGNLTKCLGTQLSARERKALLWEHFKRLGENYSCGIKTAGMDWAQLEPHLEFAGLEKISTKNNRPNSMVMAIGHFGNFELYARANRHFPERQFATTYRALRPPGLNRLLVELRTRSGCLVFERRHESGALRTAMSHGRLVLGLLSDQHAGSGGAWIPFFGQPCSTTTAPAVFALRYKTPLHTAICYRVGLARWRLEIGDAIPTQVAGERRSSEEIMSDVNRTFEAAIQRDPANWFWVHRRWKANHPKSKRLTPGATVQKPLQEVEDGA